MFYAFLHLPEHSILSILPILEILTDQNMVFNIYGLLPLQPQCCQRMIAAVKMLEAASKVLPLLERDARLAVGTRFLVPPFEELSQGMHLLRCVELLEQGCALDLEDFRQRRFFSWEQAQDNVSLSEHSLVAQGSGDSVALGTPLGRGTIVYTIVERSGSNDFHVGVALDGYDSEKLYDQAITLYTYYHGQPVVRGEKLHELNGDRNDKPDFMVKDQIRVEYDGRSVEFFVNDEVDSRFSCSVTGTLRPLVIFSERGAVKIGGWEPGVGEIDHDKRAERLNIDRATELLALDGGMSTWEARVFGSLCVSPSSLSTASGEIALSQLAAGQLADVTLTAKHDTSRDVAFLAHFVARCCKTQVFVFYTGFSVDSCLWSRANACCAAAGCVLLKSDLCMCRFGSRYLMTLMMPTISH